MKLMKTFKAGDDIIAYWITNTDWSGFVAHDIDFDVVTGDIKAFSRFSGKEIDNTFYAKHFKT